MKETFSVFHQIAGQRSLALYFFPYAGKKILFHCFNIVNPRVCN